jgi:cation diffusion facilitator family transporter
MTAPDLDRPANAAPMLDQRKDALYAEVMGATLLGLGINLALGVAKLLGGLIGHSFALLSDAVNSLGDVATSAAVLYAFRVAQKPPDAEHPYGHTRAEAIAGSYVALVVLVSALWVGFEAIRRMPSVHGAPPAWTLLIAGANVLIKEALYRYKIRLGRRTGSLALIANAWDHRADAFSALAVLVGLGAIRLGGPSLRFADEVAGLIVVSAIIWSAGNLLRESASELMDVQAEEDYVDAIRQAAGSVPGVAQVDKLYVRKSGLEYLVDIHIQVPADWTVARGHHIGHLVKDELLARFSNLRDVLVHLEPYPHHEEAARAEGAVNPPADPGRLAPRA